MAILVHLKSEVLCLSCHRRVLTPWKSYMVCIHIVGVWKFLRIGAGADSVKVAFCTVCPACPGGKAIATGDSSSEDVGEDEFDEAEDKLYKIQLLAASKPLRNTMTDIKKGNDIVIIERFEVVERWLTKVRPLLEVGKDVRFLCDDLPGVSAGGRNSVVLS
ncbi:hypothetical protein BKA61DRAFT_680584 [Leptodontidium sp. MPI-SDFR-AT-0119]|nr:hypothetical protein BKA61DRAFT_680584 [Leptodontidium sp. MPI-SDFR-AT-0119]